jgi:hypothetical protein
MKDRICQPMAELFIKLFITFLLYFAALQHGYAQTFSILNPIKVYYAKDKIKVIITNNKKTYLQYYVSLFIQDNAINPAKMEWHELIQDIRHNNISKRLVIMKKLKPSITDTLTISCNHIILIPATAGKDLKFKLVYFSTKQSIRGEAYSHIFKLKNK